MKPDRKQKIAEAGGNEPDSFLPATLFLDSASFGFSIEACCMALHPKSKIVAIRALHAVTGAEERRLLATINSDETPPDEMSKALNDLHKLWSQIVLKLADIEDANRNERIQPFA